MPLSQAAHTFNVIPSYSNQPLEVKRRNLGYVPSCTVGGYTGLRTLPPPSMLPGSIENQFGMENRWGSRYNHSQSPLCAVNTEVLSCERYSAHSCPFPTTVVG